MGSSLIYTFKLLSGFINGLIIINCIKIKNYVKLIDNILI